MAFLESIGGLALGLLGAALAHGAQLVLKACRRGAGPVLFGCVQIQHGDSPSIISNASR
jgi:hypothetical protein